MRNAHLFIIDQIEAKTLAINTSVRIAFALHEQGEEIYFTELENLFAISHVGAQCRCRRVAFTDSHLSIRQEKEIHTAALTEFAVIHMRKDPPLNLAYISATWHLDHVSLLVLNRPQALRDYNEKMAVLLFPNHTVKSLVGADCEQIVSFITTELEGNAIVKPLEMFGGQGVFRVHRLSLSATRSRIREALQTQKTPLIVQQFREEVFAGEVRAFYAFGKPLAWCLKRPAPGKFLANTAQGATLLPYSPTPLEIKTATFIAQQLLTKGIYLIGFDMIAGLVSEINITSPRLLLPPDTDENPYPELARLINDHSKTR